jgi:Fe-S-cluster containining protein
LGKEILPRGAFCGGFSIDRYIWAGRHLDPPHLVADGGGNPCCGGGLRPPLTPPAEMIRVASMEPQFIAIDMDQTFNFACGPQVDCFNACCHDLNHFLYPYDLMRLCRYLELPSGVFLERYVRIHDGPQTGLPVATLRLDPARGLACPFVQDDGCRVYPARPAACRLYPLARAVTRCTETGQRREHFALLREPHCKGHACTERRTVAAWVQDQDLAVYNRMNDPLVDIIALKRRGSPGPLSLSRRQMVQQALYDPDRFRRFVLDRPGGDPLTASPAQYERLADDDEVLLDFAYRWVAALLRLPSGCSEGASAGNGSDSWDESVREAAPEPARQNIRKTQGTR